MKIRLSDIPDPDVREAIVGPLVAYNVGRTGLNDSRPLILAIEDSDQRTLGGLWGRTGFGWLFVEFLVVPEALRGQGLGSELMTRAESEAISRGCRHAWLDTFEFQARGFYERLGYSCFGQLENYPPGHSRYFMKKSFGDGC